MIRFARLFGTHSVKKQDNWPSFFLKKHNFCNNCQGRGVITCMKCNGRKKIYLGGRKEHLCNKCGGQGSSLCIICCGSGRYIKLSA